MTRLAEVAAFIDDVSPHKATNIGIFGVMGVCLWPRAEKTQRGALSGESFHARGCACSKAARSRSFVTWV